jgi:hypothetical protein
MLWTDYARPDGETINQPKAEIPIAGQVDTNLGAGDLP